MMVVYLLTLLTSFAMLVVVPITLASSLLDYMRTGRSLRILLVAACIFIGFFAGIFLGWALRPFDWSLSFVQTLSANLGDHSVEYHAERVLLYVLMTGSGGAWLSGILAGIISLRLPRRV